MRHILLKQILICIFCLSTFANAEQPAFVTLDTVSTPSAWWLRANYHPFSTTVRGIPVNQLSKDWCYANEFKPELFPSEFMQEASIGSELSFALEGKFATNKQLTALVGAYETCHHEKGVFILILEQRGQRKFKFFLEPFQFQKTLVALRSLDDNNLELWWCASCDNSQVLIWNKQKRKFEWHSNGMGDEE